MIKKLDETVVLKNGRVVTAALFDSVYAEVEKRLQAGWCMKHIAGTEHLPVELIDQKSNKSLLYRKK